MRLFWFHNSQLVKKICLEKIGILFNGFLFIGFKAELETLNSGKNAAMGAAKEGIEYEKTAQWQAEGQSMLFEVKRQNVALQIEAAYRERLMTVYNEVKRRLDFQVAKQEVSNNFR